MPAKARGLVLFYYGDGKGKTTAAVGTAVRAKGAGLRVCFLQFMKSPKWLSHERQILKKLGIPVKVMGSGFVGIIDDKHSLQDHKKKAQAALKETRRLVVSKKFEVIVADELGSAVDEGLLSIKDVINLIRKKPTKVHLIITGHSAYPRLTKACDLVTLMKKIKHPYYTEGMLAQRGIDF